MSAEPAVQTAISTNRFGIANSIDVVENQPLIEQVSNSLVATSIQWIVAALLFLLLDSKEAKTRSSKRRLLV